MSGVLDHGSSGGWERRVRTSERLTFQASLGQLAPSEKGKKSPLGIPQSAVPD